MRYSIWTVTTLIISSTLRDIKLIDHILKRYARQWLAGCSEKLRNRIYIDKSGERAKLRERALCLSADVDAHIRESVIAPQCLALCQMFQKMLPRELKDMIYEELLHGSKICVTEADPVSRPKHAEKAQRRTSNHPSQKVLEKCGGSYYAHVMNDMYTDTCTRAEFTEAWYRVTTFCIEDPECIPQLMTVDRRGNSADPQSPIRRVELTLPSMPTFQIHTRDHRNGLTGTLQPLLMLREGAKVTLNIRHRNTHPWCRWTTPEHLKQGIAHLTNTFSTIGALVKAGCNVKVNMMEVAEFDVKGIEQLTVEYWTDKARLVVEAGLAV